MPPASTFEDDRTAHEIYLGTKTFGSLDGLRAASIIAVLWHHSARDTGPRSILVGRGFLGVDLFFVISGFLIVTLLLRERRRTGTVSLSRFYARRFLRIFPPYYLMLLVVAAAAFLGGGNTSAGMRHDLPFAIFYLSNLVPMSSLLAITWSLSTEEQFYLVVPALEKYARRQLPLLLPLAYVVVSLPPFGFFPGLNLPGFFRQTTFGPILLGVMLAHALDHPIGFALLRRVLGHRLAPLMAAALLLALCAYPREDLSGWPRLAIHAAMTALLCASVIREDHLLRPVLGVWPIRRIGVVSYGMYLFHMLVRHVIDKAAQRVGGCSEGLFFVALLLLTWAVAETSFRLYESRFLALKSRFAN
jgi:peptidoglycan/LPS O-acetylase OafA/YrhL